jgi:endogenous inhibitor of DNA gyrase (YacG/DUF329 family)
MSCPVCGEDTVHKYRPFCSRRCADIDLGKWLNEDYSVPVDVEDLDQFEYENNEVGKNRPH